MTANMRSRLAAAGFDVRRVRRLSRRGDAPAFRLNLVDGRDVKMRVCATIAAADQIWDALVLAAGGTLPRPLGRLGRTIVTEYIDGVPLDRHLRGAALALERRMARAAGRLAADLHRLPLRWSPAARPVEYEQFVVRAVRRLGRRGWLDRGAVSRLVTLSHPAVAPSALTHGDLGPENLIVAGRRLQAIDEERLAVRPVAFDLARAVARWPLDPDLERAFLDGYDRAGGDSRAYRAYRTFWIAAALTTSAVYRLATGRPGLRAGVRRLRALAATLPAAGQDRA